MALIEFFGPVVVECLLFEVGLVASNFCNRSVDCRVSRVEILLRGFDPGALRIDIRRALHIFKLRKLLTSFHRVALFDIEADDLAEPLSPDVDVGLCLDLAGAGYHA